jgi:hypothetical protein
MTKKDYIEFARMMAYYSDKKKIDKKDLVTAMGDLFHRDNYNFDRERFEAACKGSK